MEERADAIQQLRNLIAVILIAPILSGCLTGDDVVDEPLGADQSRISIRGSVGDGPIVSASMQVLTTNGAVLAAFESDASANYSIDVEVRDSDFPLRIEAQGGTDLVTNAAPDFRMLGAVFDARASAFANVNPHSTIAIEMASMMPGGIGRQNLIEAGGIVANELNFGLASLLSTDAMTDEIGPDNIAEIVRASEAVGELVRRVQFWMSASGNSVSGDQVIRALAADLSDGVLDGVGAAGSDPRLAAIASVAAAQVALETLSNELHVNGENANALMTAAILTVSGPGAQPLDELTSTLAMIYQAQIGLAAAAAATSDTAIESLLQSTAGFASGLNASLIRGLLPDNYRGLMETALSQVANGDATVIDQVNSTVRSREVDTTPNPMPDPDPTPDPDPAPEPNRPPVISGTPPDFANAGQQYRFTPGSSDPDGDTLTFSARNLPSWLNLRASDGRLRGIPDDTDAGIYSDIYLIADDGSATSELGPFSISVSAPIVPNRPPTIAGIAPGSATVGITYRFLPEANDPDADQLTFSVENLPSWATFDSANGTIEGVPESGDVNIYSGIVISVTDGEATVSLAPFSIAVQALATGTATLSWSVPTANSDGSPLTDLAGFKVYWGQNGSFSNSVTIENPGVTDYVVEYLGPGTWSFVATAFNDDGIESEFSVVAVKTIQ